MIELKLYGTQVQQFINDRNAKVEWIAIAERLSKETGEPVALKSGENDETLVTVDSR